MLESIRKFGLQHCDLPTMLWNVSFMLRVLTLNIDSKNTKSIPIVFHLITWLLGSSYLFVYLFSMIWFVFWKDPSTRILIHALIAFSLGVASEIGNTKLLCMIFYRNNVRQLVDHCLICDSKVKPESRFSKKLLKTLRIVKKRAMIFWVIIMANGFLYILRPLITPGRHLIEDFFVLYGLDPPLESPNYEITFLLSAAGVLWTVYLPANITAYLIIISGYIEAQMLALSEEVLNMWNDAIVLQKNHSSVETNSDGNNNNNRIAVRTSPGTINNNQIINEYINLKLQEIVKIHTTNISLLRQVENIFRWAIALEFLLLIVSLIAELLGGLENTYLEVPFALMQVGMDCLTGQRVTDASVEFETAVYSSKWENFNLKNRKTILLILQNSQKNMRLSAGGVAMLNFRCLMMIIRSIYSAYTALRSTMNK